MNILRLFRNAIGGSLKPTGRLVAEKISRSATPVVKISTGDSIGLHIKAEKVRLHGQGDESEAIRVSDSEGISSSVNLSKAGTVNQYVVVNKGNVPQNEEGGEETCCTLIPRLNVSGYNIDAATLVRIKDQDDDADFTVKNADRDFFIQVTRAAPSRTFWGSLASSRRQEHHWASVEESVEGIRSAIERKTMKIRNVSQRN